MIAYGATVGPCFTYWEVWFLISGFLNVSVEFCEIRTTLLYSWDATIATDLWWCIPVVGEPQPQSITVNEMIHVHVIDGCVLAPTSRLSDLLHHLCPGLLDAYSLPSFLQQTAIMSKDFKELTREEVLQVRIRHTGDTTVGRRLTQATAQQGWRPG